MFKEIQQLMDDGVSFMTVTVVSENGALRVNFIPKASGEGDLTATPLSLLGAADDLDAGFIDAIRSYRSVRRSIADQVAQSNAEAKALAKEASEKAMAEASNRTAKQISRATSAKSAASPTAKAKAEPKVSADIGALF